MWTVPDADELDFSLTGLPEKLIRELEISSTDILEKNIIKVLEMGGGTLPINKVMIGLYRLTTDIHKRTTIANKLYRMSKRGILASVRGKKGVFTIYTQF